jgi:hypothetical protein
MRIKFFLVAFFLFGLENSFSQTKWFVVEDLQPGWLSFEGDNYVPYEGRKVETIYFRVDADKYPQKIFIHHKQSGLGYFH